MHAVARIMLDGLIPNIQVSWVKLGVDACQAILRAGANDFGGTLMEETISRMAGAEWGIEMTPGQFDDAISAEELEGGITRVWVHIADVSAARHVPVRLAGWPLVRHDGAKERGMRQGTSSAQGLSPRRFVLQNHTDVISEGKRECITTSLGKNERGVANTTQRSSSPRREAHRGRPSGSAASVPCGSNA